MAISITLTDDDALDYLSMRRLDAVEQTVNLDDYVKGTTVAAADLPETGALPNVPPAPTVLSSADAVTPTTAPGDGSSILLDPDLAFGTRAPSPVPTAPTVVPPAPPSPPAPPASESSLPPSPPPIVPVEVTKDTSGIPWDTRIHSASKALNQNGTWRTKRGVDDATLATVTAELKTLMGLPSPQLPLTGVPTAPPAVLWPHAPGYGLVPPDSEAGKAILSTQAPPVPTTLPLAPPPPPLPTPPVPPTVAQAPQATIAPSPAVSAAPSGAITTLAQLMPAVMAKIQAGLLTKERVGEACKSVGVVALPLLANRPDLIPTIVTTLGL